MVLNTVLILNACFAIITLCQRRLLSCLQSPKCLHPLFSKVCKFRTGCYGLCPRSILYFCTAHVSSFQSRVRSLYYLWRNSERLARRYTTRSSSGVPTPTTASSLKISVRLFTCPWTESPSFSVRECSRLHSSNLLAHVFFWNWLPSFFQTSSGSVGSPTRYNNDGSITNTIVAKARSLRVVNFATCQPGSCPVLFSTHWLYPMLHPLGTHSARYFFGLDAHSN